MIMKKKLLLFFALVVMVASCAQKESVNDIENQLSIQPETSTNGLESLQAVEGRSAALLCVFNEETVNMKLFCSFDPETEPNQAFPIATEYNGVFIHAGYTFLWSNGSESTAISPTYLDLPVSVIVTEETTGCTVTLTLDVDYWE